MLIRIKEHVRWEDPNPKQTVPAEKILSEKLVKKTISRRSIIGILLAGTALISAPTTLKAALALNYIIFNPADNGVTDNSAALQTAIDTAWAQPFGGTVYCAPCSVGYVIDNINLRNQVDVLGGGMRETAFLAKPGSTNPVFVLDTGHVINTRYENFIVSASPQSSFTATGSGTNLTISGVSGVITLGSVGTDVIGVGVPINTYIVSQTSGTPGGAGVYVTNNATTASAAACTGISRQHCFALAAVLGGNSDAGLWYTIFKNIGIVNFGGYSWWLRGGPNSFVQPHQFITFDTCIAIRPNNYYSRCVLMTGQCGQIKFQGICDFDGLNVATNGFNIEMGAEFVSGSLIGGPLVGATTAAGGGNGTGTAVNGPRTPYNIIFHGVTSQNALTAIFTYNTFNVVIDSCYFEDVAQVIVASVAYNTSIINNHFANSGILPTATTPVNSAFSTATTGGSLAAGTYYYRVSATNANGETLASAETSQVVPAGTSTNTVTVNWGAVTGATGYKVYGRTTGAELLIASVGAVTTYVDTGSITPAGALPTVSTSGIGFIISMTNGSYGNVIGSDYGSPDRFIANGAGNGSGQLFTQGNLTAGTPGNLDSNVSWAVNGPIAALRYAQQCYINAATTITSFTSYHTVGTRVSFVNDQGGASVAFTSGNNIKLGHWTTLTLGNFDTALFELSDAAAGWQLIGTTGTLS